VNNAEQANKASDAIELQGVPEQSFSTDLILRIENIRARHLSQEGRDALHKFLLDLTNRILGEGLRLASADDKNESSLIESEHVKLGFTLVIDKLAVIFSRKSKWKTALESVGVGGILACLPALYDRHFYFAIGFLGVTVVCLGALYVFSSER
jgi:hypothetical protein